MDAAHIESMQSIVSARWQKDCPLVGEHVGDIAWTARQALPSRVVLLDDLAYAFVRYGYCTFGARPGHEHLYVDLIDAVGEDAPFWALDTETDKIEALSSRGFAPEDDGHTWHLVHDLDDLREPAVPNGWSVRDATDPATCDARVDVHRAAWEPSKFTREMYDVVRSTPPYRADLDVGIVSPDGTWASYTIAWLDADARAGELEPVGTAPAHRRRGLGAAACLNALHRLRAAGATTCVVGAVTDPDNQGPRHLYESIGFRVAGKHRSFRRS